MSNQARANYTSLSTMLPQTSFHFLVIFHGITGNGTLNGIDIRFQKVSGISLSIENKDKLIGGMSVKLPDAIKYSNIVLTRGYPLYSPMRKDMEEALSKMKFTPRDVQILLLGANSEPIASWMFRDAYPVKWAISELDATKSGLLIETIELTYKSFKRESVDSYGS